MLTGEYNHLLNKCPTGDETSVKVGGTRYENHGKHIRQRDVVVFRLKNGRGLHASIVLKVDDVITVATGWESQPRGTINIEQVIGTFREKRDASFYYPEVKTNPILDVKNIIVDRDL